MKFLIFIFALTLSQINGILIDCEFKYARNRQHKNFEHYKCYAKLITYENNEDIVSNIIGDGQHKRGKNDSDVTMFHSDKNIFKKFPKNIAKFFENIEMVDVYEAKLKEIHNNDLQQFGRKLKSLFLIRNELTKITTNDFVYNPNLEWINLSENNIVHVEYGTFSLLKKLNKLFFKLNPCHSGSANEPNALKELNEKIEVDCKSELYFQHQTEALDKKYEKLKDENAKMMLNITQLQERIVAKNEQIDDLMIKINRVEKKKKKEISNFNAKIAELREKCNVEENFVPSIQNLAGNVSSEIQNVCKKN